jgi:hypothetical protein
MALDAYVYEFYDNTWNEPTLNTMTVRFLDDIVLENDFYDFMITTKAAIPVAQAPLIETQRYDVPYESPLQERHQRHQVKFITYLTQTQLEAII